MTRIVAMPESMKVRITTAQFLRMCEADLFGDDKVELVDGELERMQQPMNNHAMRQAQVVVRLAQAIGEERVRGEAGIPLSDDTAITCDAAVLAASIATDRHFQPADFLLVVEIAETTLRRDLGMKRGKYAAANIPLYWVVDGNHSVVHVHAEPMDGEYTNVRTVRFGEPLAVPGTDETITLS